MTTETRSPDQTRTGAPNLGLLTAVKAVSTRTVNLGDQEESCRLEKATVHRGRTSLPRTRKRRQLKMRRKDLLLISAWFPGLSSQRRIHRRPRFLQGNLPRRTTARRCHPSPSLLLILRSIPNLAAAEEMLLPPRRNVWSLHLQRL
jgi:hypothetical protein